jgi:hypothetical protein
MKNIRDRKTLFNLAAPAALAVALALIVTSCAQQSESPVAPSGVRGGTLNEDTGGTTPTPEPTVTPTPEPSPTPPAGVPCSPGYWKNHESEFAQFCGAAAAVPGDQFTTCGQLYTALTCKGSDASCGRSAAAAALNTVSSCTE